MAAILTGVICLLSRPAVGSEPTVELVLADSEHQARVVGRAMRSGFFIDQLLIPETSYVGRLPWSDVIPGVREALAEARPGEPYLLTGAQGKYLVARVLPSGPPALLGESAFAEEREAIWAVLSVGPTDSRLLSLEVDVDTDDLAAICRSKQHLIENKLRTTRETIASLPSGASAQALIKPYAEVISLLSFQGEMAASIEAFEAFLGRLPSQTLQEQPMFQDTMHHVLGLLELRRGEVENCLHHHNREMCLFPLSEAARHRLDDGARQALSHFNRHLERDPTDLEVRWLLNITAMTLGSYPDGIPDRFLIPPESFVSRIDPGRFWDVATPAGLGYSDNAGGVVTEDFDGDGLLDIAVSSRDPCEPLRLYSNRGDGTFADLTEAAGLVDQLGGLNINQTDYDGDGRLDLLVMRGGWETAIRNSLLRNLEGPGGGVVFEDVTDRAGLGGPAHRTQSAAWADYDGDGQIDLFAGNELAFSQLFRNRGDGTFEETTEKAGLRFRSFTKGVTWGDIDGNGRPDLYVSNYGDRNLLFVNLGAGRFEEVGRERGVSEPTYSFTTWFWDYDNDGWQDLLVVTLLQTVDEVTREFLGQPQQDETLRIYRNRGDGTFEDATAALGMARNIPTMGANFGDLDNDGFLDMYLGTGAPSYAMLMPNRLFLNREGRSFVDVTTSTGTGHLQKGHGVSFADLDNDGDEDIFSNMGGAFPGDKYPNALFENPGHGNDWLTLELVGKRSNRAAIGARVHVVLDRGGSESHRYRWVTSGGTFGASPLMQHIGLGRGARIPRVEIDWPARATDPGSTRQVVHDVPVNSFVTITEGAPGFELTQRPRFRFASGNTEDGGPHRGH